MAKKFGLKDGKGQIIKTLEMGASEKLANYSSAKTGNEPEMSLRMDARLVNMNADDSLKAFMKAWMADRSFSLSGSFSFKIGEQAAKANEEALEKIVSNVHGETDRILTVAYGMLTEQERKVGEQIAKQNYIRNEMKRLMKADGNDKLMSLIETAIVSDAETVIPNTPQVQCTLVGGHITYTDPGDVTFKKITIGGVAAWRRMTEIYGRKRIPLTSQQAIEAVFEELYSFAKSWEDAWSNKIPTDDQMIIETVLAWSETLKGKNRQVESVRQSEATLKQWAEIAQQKVRRIYD